MAASGASDAEVAYRLQMAELEQAPEVPAATVRGWRQLPGTSPPELSTEYTVLTN